MNITIVIPTYNEKENLTPLIEEIFNLDLNNTQIVVVDDNSPDGTGKIADNIAQKYPQRISVVHRPKKLGLGSAYLDGFKKALERKAELIVSMDADFSHHPKYLPKMIDKTKDFDIVLGSRYVEGGAFIIPSLFRKFLSWFANLMTRTLLGIQVKDSTAGYKIYCREFIESLDFDTVSSTGYAFQVEMIYNALRKNFTLKEVPIIFVYRNLGKSKVSAKEIFGSTVSLFKLAFRHNQNNH